MFEPAVERLATNDGGVLSHRVARSWAGQPPPIRMCRGGVAHRPCHRDGRQRSDGSRAECDHRRLRPRIHVMQLVSGQGRCGQTLLKYWPEITEVDSNESRRCTKALRCLDSRLLIPQIRSYGMESYLGRMMSAWLPRISNSPLSPPTTSPSPPTCTAGAHSGAIMATCIALRHCRNGNEWSRVLAGNRHHEADRDVRSISVVPPPATDLSNVWRRRRSRTPLSGLCARSMALLQGQASKAVRQLARRENHNLRSAGRGCGDHRCRRSGQRLKPIGERIRSHLVHGAHPADDEAVSCKTSDGAAFWPKSRPTASRACR
jgi:hypothetical protein